MTTYDKKPRVLLVEDSASNAMVYRSYLEADYSVVMVGTGADALDKLGSQKFDLVLTDVRLPDMTGLDILDQIQQSDDPVPVVVMTAHGSVDVVVDSMQRGASDFLSKPFEKARLLVTLENILKKEELKDIVIEYEKSFQRNAFHEMVGASLPMQNVYRIIESASKSNATVFITGESGTGKELCAAALHAESLRRDKPFIPLNCAAIPKDLLESEIFGHVKGAFTGATGSREGAAARASGGTLFLDEIGEMPMDLQSKLLRFIQSGTFQPVGANREVKVDVRFICATNRDPLEEVSAGRFREDLYYRLHVIPLEMPPLRQRGTDSLLIAERMLKQCADEEKKGFRGFSEEVKRIFLDYGWPGNVRELGNVVRNIVVLNDGDMVRPDMLPDAIRKGGRAAVRVTDRSLAELGSGTEVPQATLNGAAGPKRLASGEIRPLWIEEKEIIERAIEVCGGNVPRAAAFLEISASTIYRKKQQWEEQ